VCVRCNSKIYKIYIYIYIYILSTNYSTTLKIKNYIFILYYIKQMVNIMLYVTYLLVVICTIVICVLYYDLLNRKLLQLTSTLHILCNLMFYWDIIPEPYKYYKLF